MSNTKTAKVVFSANNGNPYRLTPDEKRRYDFKMWKRFNKMMIAAEQYNKELEKKVNKPSRGGNEEISHAQEVTEKNLSKDKTLEKIPK